MSETEKVSLKSGELNINWESLLRGTLTHTIQDINIGSHGDKPLDPVTQADHRTQTFILSNTGRPCLLYLGWLWSCYLLAFLRNPGFQSFKPFPAHTPPWLPTAILRKAKVQSLLDWEPQPLDLSCPPPVVSRTDFPFLKLAPMKLCPWSKYPFLIDAFSCWSPSTYWQKAFSAFRLSLYFLRRVLVCNPGYYNCYYLPESSLLGPALLSLSFSPPLCMYVYVSVSLSLCLSLTHSPGNSYNTV